MMKQHINHSRLLSLLIFFSSSFITFTCSSLIRGGDDNNDRTVQQVACGRHEVYTECSSSTCFEETCAEIHNPIINKPCSKDCKRGCQCKPGYYRSFDGRCVDEESCILCGYGEEWLNFSTNATVKNRDKTCERSTGNTSSEVSLAEMNLTMSGCKCDEGYYRTVDDGLCSSTESCQLCGKNEVWDICNGFACHEFTCDFVNVTISERSARACIAICQSGCICHPGFFRDELTGDCVTRKTCLNSSSS